MAKIAIMTDTNSGISVAEGQSMGVYVVPMPVLIDGDIYYEGVDLYGPGGVPGGDDPL